MKSKFWVRPEDVYWRDTKLSACAKPLSHSTYNETCTRPILHEGECGLPNWKGHAEVSSSSSSVTISFTSEHDWRPVTFKNMLEFETFWQAIHDDVLQRFVNKEEEENDDR